MTDAVIDLSMSVPVPAQATSVTGGSVDTAMSDVGVAPAAGAALPGSASAAAASAGVAPNTSGSAAPSAASTTSASNTGGAGRSVAAQTLRMNQYFKQHGLPHTEQHRLTYHEYTRANNGAEPPVTLFAGHTTTAIPPPTTGASGTTVIGDAIAGPTTSSSGGTGTTSVGAPSSSSSSSSAPMPHITPQKKNVDLVQTICRMAFTMTHDERLLRQSRIVEVQQTLNSLKNTPPVMSVLQANLMYQPDRPQQPPQQVQAAAMASQQQAHLRGQNPSAGSTGGTLAAMPPGSNSNAHQAGYDPRYDPRRQGSGGFSSPSMQGMTPSQQAAYQAQRGAKRKEPPNTNTNPINPTGLMTGMMLNQPGAPAKYRKEAQETSAAELRTQRALEMQNQNLATPYPGIAIMGSSPDPAMGQPFMPATQPSPPVKPRYMPPTSGQGNIGLYHQPPPPQPSRAQQVRQSLLGQWHATKAASADKDHLYLEPTPLVNKLLNIAESHGLSLQTGDAGIASVELLMLATESFLKNILQSARHIARRRQDVAKTYLPTVVTNEPRRELDELQRTVDERKMRWAKHRERATDESKRKPNSADAKNAESDAKPAGAVPVADKPIASSAGGDSDDYLMSLVGGGLTGANPSSATPPSAAPSTSSFLPPSSIQTKSFLPSTSIAASTQLQPTIIMPDLLAAMESHPHIRKSARLYKSLTLLGKKRTIPPPAPPTPAPAATPAATPAAAPTTTATPAAAAAIVESPPAIASLQAETHTHTSNNNSNTAATPIMLDLHAINNNLTNMSSLPNMSALNPAAAWMKEASASPIAPFQMTPQAVNSFAASQIAAYTQSAMASYLQPAALAAAMPRMG